MPQPCYQRKEMSSSTGPEFLSLSLERCYFAFRSRLGLQHTLALDNINYLSRLFSCPEPDLKIQ